MRRYSQIATQSSRRLLDQLLKTQSPTTYGQALAGLGVAICKTILPKLSSTRTITVAFTAEDADYLARGFVSVLSRNSIPHSIACFWNVRGRIGDKYDIAPIIRRYIEPASSIDTLIIIKSIISGSCVVRTNLTELIAASRPNRIFIVSPVMLVGADARLEAAFPADISSTFSYIWLAKDDKSTPSGEVVPGIGGMIYEKLGLGDRAPSARYVPKLIRERRTNRYRLSGNPGYHNSALPNANP